MRAWLGSTKTAGIVMAAGLCRLGEPPMRIVKFVGFFILFLAVLVLIFQNTEATTVTFFGWSRQLPLAATIIAALGAGFVLGALATGLLVRRSRRAHPSNRIEQEP
jgi:uncharacterized integral membrane protein